MRRGFSGRVIAAVIVIVPHVNQRRGAVKITLVRRGQNLVVSRQEKGCTVGFDIFVVKVTHVHVEQRLMLPNAVVNLARGTGPAARRERNLEGSWFVCLGEGAKLAHLA